MFLRAFQHRSGRVCGLVRVVLAGAFLLAVWFDPSQPVQFPAFGYLAVSAYLLAALTHLLLIWNDWWLEHRLARAAHAIDIVTFTLMLVLTQGYSNAFVSPFFAFYIFILLSAAVRWGWKAAALTAAVLIILFGAVGIIGVTQDLDNAVEVQRYIQRSIYFALISLIILWFGLNQQAVRGGGRLDLTGGADFDEGLPVRRVADYAASNMNARHVLLAWWDREGAWTHVADLSGDQYSESLHEPEEGGSILHGPMQDRAFLFDQEAGRTLLLADPATRRLESVESKALDPAFAERFNLRRGIAIRVRSIRYEGELFVAEMDGPCTDDLVRGHNLGRRINAALDRYAVVEAVRQSAVDRTKISLARDLHDSVTQLLLGTSMRLEAVRRDLKDGQDCQAQIKAIQEDLKAEHADIRKYIGGLRGRRDHRQVDLKASIEELTSRLGKQWCIACDTRGDGAKIEVPAWLEHEIQQMLREAVANSVRHGGANVIDIQIDAGAEDLRIAVSDNGRGFPAVGAFSEQEMRRNRLGPWSLSERANALGGSLALISRNTGSHLTIILPNEAGA